MISPTGAIDWEAVKSGASITECRCIEDIPYLCTIVQNYGGGHSGQFIRKLSEFVTAAVPDNRRLPSSFWAALAKLKVEADALSPFVFWSIVKAEAKAPEAFVSGGVTSYISKNEISSLGDKKRMR